MLNEPSSRIRYPEFEKVQSPELLKKSRQLNSELDSINNRRGELRELLNEPSDLEKPAFDEAFRADDLRCSLLDLFTEEMRLFQLEGFVENLIQDSSSAFQKADSAIQKKIESVGRQIDRFGLPFNNKSHRLFFLKNCEALAGVTEAANIAQQYEKASRLLVTSISTHVQELRNFVIHERSKVKITA